MNRVTKKRTPLGPRQKAAYVKPYREAIEVAKKKVAEQRAATDKAEANLARLRQTILLRKAQGTDTTLATTDEVRVYGLYAKTDATWRRTTRESIVTGAEKVAIPGGSPGAPALAKRMRLMAPADIRKLRALDKRIRALSEAREQLIVASFDRGQAWTPEGIADFLVKRAIVQAEKPGWVDTHAIIRAEAALAEALKHDGTATCPCSACETGRSVAAREKAWKVQAAKREAEAARFEAKRPRRTFTCGECGTLNENSPIELDENDGIEYVACSKCETGISLEELDEAAKVAAPSPGQTPAFAEGAAA